LARLGRRGQRWRSLTEIPVGLDGGHIDHLVVGPGGIFTVDARSHPRSRISVRGNVFRVDGVAYPYISASRHEALRAARCLSAACGFPVEVMGLVVVIGAEEIAVEEDPIGVRVLADTALETWLRRREQRIDGPTFAAVYDAARRSTTWNVHSN
jgi:hypothetical protein